MATRIAIIGGFLGAGKTTLLTGLAKEFMSKGKTVAIITNDQGEVLVDTQFSKEMGIDTAEVLKGCFCCKFPDFIGAARKLVDAKRPDIIMAEPVGSCTDLLATVVAPLKFRFPSEFNVAPLVIMLDATRISEGIEKEGTLGAYLRRHQVQEAEVIVLSKTDLLGERDVTSLVKVVKELNAGARVIPYSAINGQGLGEIAELVISRDKSLKRPVDVDYDLYAQAEAELGWYNGRYRFVLHDEMDSYGLATSVLMDVSKRFAPSQIAHVKLLFTSPLNALKMSLVMESLGLDGVRGGRRAVGECVLDVNARIISSPEDLKKGMREAVLGVMESKGIKDVVFEDDCFSPGRPRPTFRMISGEN